MTLLKEAHMPRQQFALLRALTAGLLVLMCAPIGLADDSSESQISSARKELGAFSGWELFLDDEAISWTKNITRRMVPPEKHPASPIVRADSPWESLYCTLHGTVRFDPQLDRFRMWYTAIGPEYRKQRYLAYAESEDGVAWNKARLDLIPFGEHQQTNLLLGGNMNVVGPSVFMLPDADPEERYMVFFDSYTRHRPESPESKLTGRAVYAASSPDGIHFTPKFGRLVALGKSDTCQSAVWNPERQVIQLYLRGVNEYAVAGGGRQRVRYVRYVESPDGHGWTEPIELLRADEQDGAPDSQIHQISVTRYGAGFLALLTLFHIERLEYGVEHRGERFEVVERGVTDTQLAYSRDGLHWRRVADRQTFLPLGHAGDWDAGWIVTASNLMVHEDEVWIYYAGAPDRFSIGGTAIGLAKSRLDRLVALRPRQLSSDGIVELKPFRYDGDVVVNADAGLGGEIRCEILDFEGRVLEGFDRDSAEPLSSDELRLPLRWADRTVADAMQANGGRAIRLRFYLRNAELFAVRNAAQTAE